MHRLLLSALALVVAISTPAVADSALEGYWPLDEGSGAVAQDQAGDNNGTVSAGAQWIAGRLGGALYVPAGERVTVSSTSALQPQRVTLSAWVRRSASPGAFRYVVGSGADGCIASSYALYTGPDGGLMFYVAIPDGTFVRSPDAGPGAWDGTWRHAMGTYDGTAVRLYLDGQEVGTGTPATEPIAYGFSASDLLMGTYGGCASLDYDGAVDEPKVFSRALARSEVRVAMGYDFKGFFAPVDNRPVVNVVKAGSAVPVKFSLSGYWGMNIFDAGSPATQVMSCGTDLVTDELETTASPGSSQLSYDAATDRYQYVWKTVKGSTGCRKLILRLADGSIHSAYVKLK